MERATCQGCETEISPDVDQCPVCGFEPRTVPRITRGVVLLVCLPVLGISIASLLYLVVHVLNGMPPATAVRAYLPIGFVGFMAAVFLYVLHARVTQTPTDSIF